MDKDPKPPPPCVDRGNQAPRPPRDSLWRWNQKPGADMHAGAPNHSRPALARLGAAGKSGSRLRSTPFQRFAAGGAYRSANREGHPPPLEQVPEAPQALVWVIHGREEI